MVNSFFFEKFIVLLIKIYLSHGDKISLFE